MDAERAFARETRARRRPAARRLRRAPRRLTPAYDETQRRASGIPARREIPLDAIAGTVEPSRAAMFDRTFRPTTSPAPAGRGLDGRAPRRLLPPICVVASRDGYAVRDGHHRASVARARGALTIDAAVEPELAEHQLADLAAQLSGAVAAERTVLSTEIDVVVGLDLQGHGAWGWSLTVWTERSPLSVVSTSHRRRSRLIGVPYVVALALA